MYMPKQTSKKDEVINLLAKSIVDKASGKPPEKYPVAVALGIWGGLKGGKTRAKILSAKKRKEIAQKAAQTRWGKKA